MAILDMTIPPTFVIFCDACGASQTLKRVENNPTAYVQRLRAVSNHSWHYCKQANGLMFDVCPECWRTRVKAFTQGEAPDTFRKGARVGIKDSVWVLGGFTKHSSWLKDCVVVSIHGVHMTVATIDKQTFKPDKVRACPTEWFEKKT